MWEHVEPGGKLVDVTDKYQKNWMSKRYSYQTKLHTMLSKQNNRTEHKEWQKITTNDGRWKKLAVSACRAEDSGHRLHIMALIGYEMSVGIVGLWTFRENRNLKPFPIICYQWGSFPISLLPEFPRLMTSEKERSRRLEHGDLFSERNHSSNSDSIPLNHCLKSDWSFYKNYC